MAQAVYISSGMVNLRLTVSHTGLSAEPRPRLSAVSYLNTLPLVWGCLHGPQQGHFDLDFSVPAICAERLRDGSADIGIVPCAELPRLGLEALHEVGIACRGPVRSILLVSKVPASKIKILAADEGSRTSVELARIILGKRYSAYPVIRRSPPNLEAMLAGADAALIIGDPALRMDPMALPYSVLDLGKEWLELTGLPMVFAVWAGRPEVLTPSVKIALRESCAFGLSHLDHIVRVAVRERGFSCTLIREYLTKNILFELGPDSLRGMELFLRYCSESPP